MKIKSKGYTLVELLISMAILAVVMVGIVSIMRTASVSFKNESVEVDLQEESQILLSQVEELLVDCNKVDTVTGGYKIKTADNNDVWLSFHDNSLYYSESGIGTGEELLASGVDEFSIGGLQASAGDNICLVSAKLSKSTGDKSYDYNATKNIVFRNNVELSEARDDTFMNNAPSGGGGGENDRTLYVGRYQVVDLQQVYGITNVVSYSFPTNAYSFINPTSVNSTTGGIDSYTTQTDKSIYFTTSATVNSSLDTEYTGTIVGTTGTTPSQTLTVNIITKACGFQTGGGVVEFPNKSVNNGDNGGFLSYVTFEGFSFIDYLKYNSTSSVSGSITFNGTTKTGTLMSSKVDNSYGQFSYQYNIGLAYDQFENDKLVVRFMNGHTSSSAANLTGSQKIKLSVTLPGNTTPYSKEYYAVSSGTNLTNVN